MHKVEPGRPVLHKEVDGFALIPVQAGNVYKWSAKLSPGRTIGVITMNTYDKSNHVDFTCMRYRNNYGTHGSLDTAYAVLIKAHRREL